MKKRGKDRKTEINIKVATASKPSSGSPCFCMILYTGEMNIEENLEYKDLTASQTKYS